MSLLPKILYRFQNIPLCPPSSFFTTLRILFTDFIWNNKWARVRLSLLYLPYNRGGLQFSQSTVVLLGSTVTIYLYYLLLKHIHLEYWIFLYKVKITLNLYLYSADIKSLRKDKDIVSFNPILINTINVWCDVYKYLCQSDTLSCFTPIWGTSVSNQLDQTQDLKCGLIKGCKKWRISIKEKI